MNRKEIDFLFKNKLQNATKKPSDEAWYKLNAKLQKEKAGKNLLWLKIAASVIVIIGISWLLVRNDINSVKTLPVVKSTTVKKITPLIPETELANNNIEEKILNPVMVKSEAAKNKFVAKKKPKRPIVSETVTEPAYVNKEADTATTQPIKIMPYNTENKQLVANIEKELPEVTIIYKKGNREQAAVAANTAPTDKKSALEKIWNVAKEIKNGEIGMADIRSTKDELFAFEFRKQKNQK